MAEIATVARPYAEAIFRTALEKNALEAVAGSLALLAALEKRYGKKVEADLDVDPQLLGGARVQIGDQVIHASVRDALAQMAAALTR